MAATKRPIALTAARVAAAALGLASCWATGLSVAGVTTASPSGASPLAAKPCRAHTGTSLAKVAFTRATSASGAVPVVMVCIAGRGPYPFIVSTGAGVSVVTPRLARTLHLHAMSEQVPVRGVTCLTSAREARVGNWSMGGVRLGAQPVLVAPVGTQGMKHAPAGIIASDVLSRFGAVRIDFRSHRLTLFTREAPPPTGNVYVIGRSTTKPPARLLAGTPKVSTVVRVLEGPEGTVVAVAASLDGHAQQLAVDSGSARSAVVPTVVSALKLRAGGKRSGIAGVGCKGSAEGYASGTWQLGGTTLPEGALASRPIAGTLNSGLQGILGTDVLSLDGSAVIDYAAAHLWLGAG